MHINTSEAKANPWDWQNYYDLESPLLQGKSYVFSMRTKASSAVTFPLWIETPNAGNTHYGIPQISAGTTWSTISIEFTPNSDCSRLLFNFGQFGGDLWFGYMVLVEKGSEQNMIKNGTFEEGNLPSNWSKPSWHAHSYSIIPTPGDAAVEILTDIITNGDAQGSETTNFVSTHVGGANAACDIVDGVGKDGSRAFVVTSAGGGTNSWDTQSFCMLTVRWWKMMLYVSLSIIVQIHPIILSLRLMLPLELIFIMMVGVLLVSLRNGNTLKKLLLLTLPFLLRETCRLLHGTWM